MRFRLLKLNQVILIFIIALFAINFAANLSAPFFAVFILQDIGAAVTVVGFASAIYWITKSILQLPVARWLDRNHGEIDDYYALIGGLAVTTFGVFLFYLADRVWHIYVIQLIIALGDAFVVPPFYAIFTRHVDPNSEGFEWSLYSSFSLGAGSALGAALAGVLASTLGIRPLFLINGTLMLLGLIVLLFLRPYIRPKVPTPVGRVFIEQKRV